jgi:hypothetical protein
MKRLVTFALFITLSALTTTLLHAQTTDNPEDIISAGINISVAPLLPGPNESVTASLDSASTDLDRSTITWSVGGKKVASGLGVKTIDLISAPQGGKTVISVNVVSPDGTFNKSYTIDSASVDLLVQGGTYTPPFYEGRSLWTFQTRYTLFAIPHVAGRTANNLIFRWSKDGESLGASSGNGQSSLTLFDSILGLPQEVTLDIMTDRDTVVATKTLTLTPREPELHVYENNPLYGYRFDKEALGTFSLTDKEVTFAAFPYYFSVTKRGNSDIIYDWLTNNGNAQVGNEVTYRAPDGGEGSSSVTASAKSLTQVLQTGEKDFLVQFNTNTNAF